MRCLTVEELVLPFILFIMFHTLFIGVLWFIEETKSFYEALFLLLIVRRALALYIRNDDNLEWEKDRPLNF